MHNRTGLVCSKCHQPVPIIDDKNPTIFRCPARGDEWTARRADVYFRPRKV